MSVIGSVGWLRAAVLGASDDDIVSTASLVVGVAAAVATCQDVLIHDHDVWLQPCEDLKQSVAVSDAAHLA